MPARYQTLRGFRDLLPGETEHWQRLEAGARELFRRYAFREIRPPHLEATELFVRSVGEATDIVGKEMFTMDAGEGETVTLRPEITASVCRAYVQNALDRAGLSRFFYIGPAFRKERPQKGRLRQFHQAGVEVLGEASPETDVEVIAVGVDLVTLAGVKEWRLLLNSIGDPACRPAYRAALVAFLEARRELLCGECQDRIERNPLRVLDCKKEPCQAATAGAPATVDHLCEACREHFAGVGGGRYDDLVRELGGGDVPGIGWAAGIERLLIAAGREGDPAPAELEVFVVTLGERARECALPLVQALRGQGLAVNWDPAGRGLGGQMKRAGRSGARFAVLVGDDELDRGKATLKDLASGEQGEGPLDPCELARLVRGKMETRG